jgi:hypothetical protein
MSVNVKIILDSISPEGIRLTTYQLRYPRMIHSEFMTHRVLSRNAGSSRAVPISEVIRRILADPANPSHWGSNKPGMQAGAELTGVRRVMAKLAWHGAKRAAIFSARVLQLAGAHKQVANRILEPWSHIEVVATGTDWVNFFALRHHKDADPTFRELAAKMTLALANSVPTKLHPGDWHLPYITEQDRIDVDHDIEKLKRMSSARCGRVSYLTHDNETPSLENDLKLFERLMGGDPKHSSPTEHQATPDKKWTRNRWAKPELHGNLRGFIQFRKTIAGEAAYEH